MATILRTKVATLSFVLFFLHFYLLDELRRIPAYNGHGRNVTRNHTVSTYYRTVADSHARQNSRINAYPHLVLYDNRTAISRAAVVGVRIMVDGYEVYLGCDEHSVADGDASTVEECATLLNPTALADAGVLAVIHIKRRQQRRRWVYFLASDAAQVLMHLLGSEPPSLVHFRSRLHRVEDSANKLVISRFVG